MKTKKYVRLFSLFLSSVLFFSFFSACCLVEEEKKSGVLEIVTDTISVPNVLSDERVLLEFGSLSSDDFATYLIPAGTKIGEKDDNDTNRRVSIITKNDFIIIKKTNSLLFFHPTVKDIDRYLRDNVSCLKMIQSYKVYQFYHGITAKEADEFIEFAELTVFETTFGFPYLVSNLEEWHQERSWKNIKDDDMVFFNRERAQKYCNQTATVQGILSSKKSGSYSPLVYIRKNDKLIALIGQDGKLWRTRQESKMSRERKL